jgi:asparagine synthase (glutamine-hydrolysing)
VRTFTIGFSEAEWDETAQARKVARLFGTQHHEALVRPDALGLLARLARQHGEPFADSSAIPTFLVSELAQRHVKVVLTGDGGDESFAGYERYRALAWAEALQCPGAAPLRWALAAGAAGAVAVGAAPVQGVLSGGGRGRGERLLRFADSLGRTPRQRNHDWRVGGHQALLDGLLTDEGRRLLPRPSFYGADVPLPLPLNEALALDVERYLPDDILTKLDLASMAHGLEARAPFLDRELMEYAAALPGRYKLGGLRGPSKLVLRKALARVLPADLLRGAKRGFGVPLDSWFRGPLLEPARDLLLSARARQRGLFRPEAV